MKYREHIFFFVILALILGLSSCMPKEESEAVQASAPTGTQQPSSSPNAAAERPLETQAPAEDEPPIGVSPQSIGTQYAPTPYLRMVFAQADEQGQVHETTYQTVVLPNMPEGYISTLYQADKPGVCTHYYADQDGLRTATIESPDQTVLVLPAFLASESVWDENTLVRVESAPQYTGGLEVACAFVLKTGAEKDILSVYGLGFGLVAQYDNATGEGTPVWIFVSAEHIDAQQALDDFYGNR